MRSLFAALMIILLLSGSVSARTWHVKPDGMGDAPTIQAGIDSASAGDTVLAAAGVYPDNVVIARSELTLASESGPSVTTIGSSASGPAIVVSAADVTIEGFSVAPGPGSGIDCYAGSRTEVSGNIISGRFWGIFANLDGGDCWAHGNVVRDNRGTGLLGCALVEENTVSGNSMGAISYCSQVSGNVIEGNNGYDWDYGQCSGVHCCDQVVDNIMRNNFGGYVSVLCGAVERNAVEDNEYGILAIGRGEAIRENLITGNQGMGGITCVGDATPLIENNTIYGNVCSGIELMYDVDPGDGTRYDPRPVIRNNIIVGNRHGIYSQAAEIEVFCNDVWCNLYEQYDGLVVHGTDISEDPLFCGVDLGDLSLRCGSPCVGGAGGCGQIGRFGVACGGPSQAIPSTWGAIKSRYK